MITNISGQEIVTEDRLREELRRVIFSGLQHPDPNERAQWVVAALNYLQATAEQTK